MNRYFETMAFHANQKDTRYLDATTRSIVFNSNWYISEVDADERANDMHEEVVNEITEGLKKGKKYLIN